MKVTVTKYLNVRVGKPSVNAPTYQYIAPGSEIEIDGQLYKGDTYDNVDTWVKDVAGNYYWSGGIQYDERPSSYAWWVRDYSIEEVWNYSKGENIKVAILDSGIGMNSNLNMKNVDGYNFTNSNNNYFDSSVGHGTHVAGIIAAKGPKVFGIAPNVSLFIAKITDDSGTISYPALMLALQKCVSLKIDVINLSLAITPAEFNLNTAVLGNLSKLVTDLVKNKIFVVAASGNLGSSLDCYPSSIPECISLAATDENNQPYADGCQSTTIDLTAPGVEIYSTLPKDQFCNLSGTSQAAAFASGIIAAAKSYMVKHNNWDFNKLNLLFQDSQVLRKLNYPKNVIGNGLINPTNLFKTIQTN